MWRSQEIAFCDALDVNDSAEVPGNETLRTIALELVRTVRSSVSIDWRGVTDGG